MVSERTIPPLLVASHVYTPAAATAILESVNVAPSDDLDTPVSISALLIMNGLV